MLNIVYEYWLFIPFSTRTQNSELAYLHMISNETKTITVKLSDGKKKREKSANDHVKELPEDWSVAARKPLWCIKDECANDEVSDENKRI